jgi:FAD/FMN-containing dehydrogenase
MENAAFGTLCRLGRARPPLIPALNRFSSAALSSRSYADVSHRVFVTPRRVRFVESEYAVPRESLLHVLGELRRQVPRLADPVMFPVEVRVAAADDIWLSTAYGRDTAYVAIHQYTGCPTGLTSTCSSPSWRKRGGAVRTGARCTPSGPVAPARSALYPRYDEFRRVRAEVDPEARFGNA